MSGLFLARARLRRDTQVAALAPLLLPVDDGARVSASHRLVWSLMPPDAAAARDFLWREEAPGRFLVLAPRPLEDTALFEVECKPFDPVLEAGDRLRFMLRANPTVSRRQPGRRGKREDAVMHALHPLPGKPPDAASGPRAAARPELIGQVGADWLRRTGARTGFEADAEALRIDGYHQLRFPRPKGDDIVLGRLEFEGALTVLDPGAFVVALGTGFGRARAFGCGLMLIRRG